MRRLITLAAALLTGLGMSVAGATGAAASVCQGSGASCTAAGTYSAGPNATINSDLNGASLVWTSSKVAPYSSGVPLSWTVYVTYTNLTSSPLLLTCQGGGVGTAYEVMSGGSGDDGTVPASSSTCTVDPGYNVTLQPAGQPGDSAQNFATFDNVPWPGSTVALKWGSAGTSKSVTPWTCAQPANSAWAGYVACGVNATSITATWAVPIAIQDKHPNSGSAFWVGFGGTTSDVNGSPSNVVQDGTASNMVNGSPKYFAWYELVPAGPVTIPKPVAAGDAITATVTLTNGDQYHFTVVDHGRWTFTKTVADSTGGHNSAEAIAEWSSGMNSCSAPSCPLTDFSTVVFSGIKAGGYSLGSYHPTVIHMYQNEATVSSLRNGTSYTAYYKG